ncbi:uncharacterized protein LOC143024793 [Oratosquilla oratoria]|uniref:uncharacterized protein LOC143024793 n=1 Tax=Oratosquilla oratoria TaxID=337810 RepID=UPI003F76C09D
MKNQSQVAAAAATNVCVRMSKAGLDGALAIMTEGVKQRAASPPPSPPNASRSPLVASATPPITIRIKAESPTLSLDSKAPSPPMSGPPTPTPSLSSGSTHVSMGPGAEVRGMQAKPISSDSKPGTPQSGSGSGGVEVEGSRGGPGGGRLTFFRDGKLLLELSHRSEGGTGGWIPVKSKTYWPPPSSTPHHPLRHDTPTTHSDDTSSVNSSPWAVDHIRKQSITQRPNSVLVELLSFSVCVSPSVRGLRRGVTRRRNPYKSIKGPMGSLDSLVQIERTKENHLSNKSAQERRSLLEGRIQMLGERRGVKIETSVTIHGLFEKPIVTLVENVDPNFISPRKRYLRQMETDSEHSLLRKRVHAAASNSVSVSSHLAEYPVASPSPSSSSSSATSHKSAISSQASSVYSIDSILKGETANKKADSFLRTLLKPEPKSSVTPKPSIVKDGVNPMSPVLKTEIIDRPERMDRPELNSASKDRNDTAHDLNKLAAERLDLSRYGTPSSLANSYLLPYLADPRLMMQSLAANSGFVTPVTAPTTEMTAAAMANVLGPYPFQAIAANPYHHLLHSALPVPAYGNPNQALVHRLLRPPTPNRTSPYPPSPKPAVSSHGPSGQVPPSATSPHMPHVPSPHRMSPWSLSSAHSPHKAAQSPVPSPPPQDAPLNLSKPRSSSGK